MKTPRSLLTALLLAALAAILCSPATAQNVTERFRALDKNSDGRLDATEAGALGFFKSADTNGDGLVFLPEAQAFAGQPASAPAPGPKRATGMEGDGAAPVFHWPVAPVKITETESPVQVIETTAVDGRASRAWWRKPKGDGPFPAILFIHGGLTEFPEASLRQHLTENPVITRLLAAGYAVVMATFRTYEQDVQSRGPIEDVRAVLRQTARLLGVDPRRIALYGGSGGGSIALELGGDPEVRAIVAGEPATVLYTGMLTTGEYGPRLEMMANPEKFFTPELRARTLEKLKTVRAPVLLLHGDQHDLHRLNKPLLLPLMKQAGIEVEYREYPGFGHGFYFGGGDDRWGKGADLAVVEQVVTEVRTFLEKPQSTTPSAAWVTPPVMAPRVQFRTFDSAAAKTKVSYHLYSPEIYETAKERRFPVLYWLHGTGGGLAGIPQLAKFFDRAMQEGKIPPMLVVFPNGLASSMWCDSKDGTAPVESMVIQEFIPQVDATFRTVAGREGRIIEGFSMGGFGAARLGFKYPQLFGAVSILAGGPLGLDFAGPRATANPAERERILKDTFGGDLDYYRAQHPITIAAQQAEAVRGKGIVRIAVGSRDGSGPLNRAYSEHLTKLNIDHSFSIVPEAGHDTLALLQGLGEANWEFYQKAFASFRQQSTAATPWILPEPDAPRMQRVLFDSKTAGGKVSCYVFTPQPYEVNKESRFPVLYWLHGSGGSSAGAAAQVARRYSEAMRAGKVPPMILVFPNGLPRGMWCDWKDGSVKLETMFIEELIPHIDGAFRTVAKREGRIIDGFSMGGYGAARLGFKYPQLFAAVSLLGAGPLQAELTETPRAGPRERERLLSTVYGGDMAYFSEVSPWRIVEQRAEKLRAGLLIRQIVGDADETLSANREFKQHLDALKIPHSYRQLPGIPHDPNLVLNMLGEDNWEFYRSALSPNTTIRTPKTP
jgi:enterochelin esterase-like enzyme